MAAELADPRRGWAIAALGFLLAFSPSGPALAQRPGSGISQPDSAAAHAYLDLALDLIQRRSINGDSVDWQSIRPAAHARVGADGSTAAAYPAIRWVLAQLRDHHSVLLEPEEAVALSRGLSRGFGFRAIYPEGTVVQVYAGGPADAAGVRVGDVMTAVDGARPSADARGALVELPSADTVRITLRRIGSSVRDLVLAAEPVDLNGLPTSRRIRGEIGYLELPQHLGEGAVGDSASYIDAGQSAIRAADSPPACGWIVDLRRNGGGNVWPMLAVIGPVLGDGVAGAFVSPGATRTWSYDRGRAMLDGVPRATASDLYATQRQAAPVAVLTSRVTASSGEAIAISFRGRPNTRSFGEATQGVPTANANFPLSDGAVLVLATAVDADRTGRRYRGRIEPDVQVRLDWPSFGRQDDPVIAAAAAWLRAQPECGGRDRPR
ncbi:MAG: PDZ domain-containing protein [Gemmatimonadetes bacterium]|nr:PDZ domain-containing protein [Gemmatimonadota bacterium]